MQKIEDLEEVRHFNILQVWGLFLDSKNGRKKEKLFVDEKKIILPK